MPINKNAFIRYKILDKCFNDKYHKYFIEDLMEKVNGQLADAGIKSISKKQIYDDIKFMKSSEGWEAPIKSYQDGKRKYYAMNRCGKANLPISMHKRLRHGYQNLPAFDAR